VNCGRRPCLSSTMSMMSMAASLSSVGGCLVHWFVLPENFIIFHWGACFIWTEGVGGEMRKGFLVWGCRRGMLGVWRVRRLGCDVHRGFLRPISYAFLSSALVVRFRI
jgi:hypothetical protein